MKRVLFLNHNQENFGTYYRCFFLAKGLSEKGYQVTMLCASGKNFDLLVRKKKINDNFFIITLPRIKYHKYFTGQLELRLPITMAYVLFGHYDICHAFTVAQPQIGIPAWLAKKIRRKKLIVDWDDAWEDGFAQHHPWPIKQGLIFFENKIPKIADYVTYVSEYIGQKLEKMGIAKKAKIPNGCNTEQIKTGEKSECRQKLNLDPGKKILVSVGNTYMNCLALLFRSLEIALKEEPNIYLYMVGEVDIYPKAKIIYDRIKNNIVLAGKKPFREIPVYMSAADILMLPMSDEVIEAARFPMRLGDYLCAARPIVSNAVGEVEYYLKKYNCGLCSYSGSPEKMAGNIIRVLKEPGFSDTISLNARRLAEGDLGWAGIFEKLETVYQNL